MDDDSRGKKGSSLDINRTIGLITALATLIGAITGLVVVFVDRQPPTHSEPIISPQPILSPAPALNPEPAFSPEPPLSPEPVVTTQTLFSAESYCSITDVYGYGDSTHVDVAQQLAVDDCIGQGGVPDCCANNVRVFQN